MSQSQYKIKQGDVLTLAKRVMYLAWQSSSVLGMGVLQDRGPQTEEQVWAAMYNRRDYPGGNNLRENAVADQGGKVYADYVNGRMMKMGVEWKGDVLTANDGSSWRPDYQSFCRQYPNFQALLSAAVHSLGNKFEVEKVT